LRTATARDHLPPRVKTIKERAFYELGLTTVTRCDGLELEEIGKEAFLNCVPIGCIVIPNDVETRDGMRFAGLRLDGTR
jgi:hypothetical protein